MMIRRLAIAVGIAVAVIGSFCCYSYLLTRRAEFIVQTAYELSELRQSPTVADLRLRFGNGLKQLDGCTASHCAYEVELSNRPLAVIRVVPYTQLKSYFSVRDGVVSKNLLDYTTTVNNRYKVVTHVQIDFGEDSQAFAIHPWGDSSPFDTNGLVGIGNQALATEKHSVLSLNIGCMTKPRGCDNVAELLPTVWQRTATDKIACRVQNHEGWVRLPAGWR